MEQHIVGKTLERIDAWAKVTGRAEFGADVHLPETVYCKGVYSQYPHAKLLAVHTEEAERAPGVVCVVTGKDIPGEKMFGEIFVDQYAIAVDRVRFLGDVIAVVAAETQEQANEAAKLVTAEYEVLPAITDPRDAIGNEQVINPDYPDNVCGVIHPQKGDAEQGLKESDIVIERNYKTGFVEQAYIEPESVTAIPSHMRRELTVIGSLQVPYNARISISRMLNIPIAQVIIRPSVVGGSFGGKIEGAEAMAVRASLIALKTGRPAKYTLTREESIRETYKRHPIDFNVKIGAMKDGTIKAVKVYALADGGCYINMTPPVMYKTAYLGCGPYRYDHLDYEAVGVITNNVHCGSMRGFGTPQAIYALENTMDELAEILGMTPTELRRKNLLKNGDTSPTGHVLDFNEVSIGAVMEKTVAELDFDRKWEQYNKENRESGRRVRRGVGIAVSMRGASIGADGMDVSRAMIEVEEDASVHLNIGLMEIGQGLRTCQSQMAADGMGVSFERISIGEVDTSRCPTTGGCIASRGTMMGGMAIKRACDAVHKIMAEAIAEKYGKSTEGIVFENDRVRFADEDISFEEAVHACYSTGRSPMAFGTYVVDTTKWDETHREPYNTYTYSCNAAEVEVDMDTGSVNVVKMVGCHDAGKAINPAMIKGQIYGGMTMAAGMAITEDLGFNPKTSALKNLNFENYLIPTAMDVNENVALLEENYDPRTAFGGRSIGEPATEDGAAAIVAAINHALGHPGLIHELPADLDRVFFAAKSLDEKKGE